MCYYLFYIDNLKGLAWLSLLRKWQYASTDHEKHRFMKWLLLYQVARIEMNETTSKRHLRNFPLPMEAAFIPLLFS